MAAIRRAAALRATERTVSNLADAVTPVVWEALVKSLGAPPWKPSMPEIERRADLARGAGEAVLAREQISTRDFEALYAPFEPMVPASALLPAPGRASLP